MPINPNIALGIQPVQQPNILGQMGQIMAIRAAQEDLEGSADVKNFFAKPAGERGDPTELLKSKRGIASFKALTEGQEKQLDIAKKNIELIGAGAGAVLQNPTLENFRSVVGNLVQNRVYTEAQAQKALDAIGNDPSKIPAFVTPLYKQAISAEKDLSAKTSIQTANIGAAAPLGQLALAQKRDARDQLEFDTIRSVLGGASNPSAVAPTGGAPMGGGGVAGTAPQPNALANQVAPQVAPAQNVNALAGGNAEQQIAAINAKINSLMGAGSKATPIVQALIAQKNAILNEYSGDTKELLGTNPNTGKLEPYLARLNKVTGQYEPVPVNEPPISVSIGGTNTSTNTNPDQSTASLNVARPKLSPQAEQQQQIEIDRARGKTDVGEVIGNLASKYQNLASTGGMTSTKKGVMENIGAYFSNTAAGQELGKMTATQEQSLRNEIKSASPILLQSIKKATGMTAKEMDSNADVKRWMEAMSTTSFDIQSALGILKSLNKQFGTGDVIPSAPAAPAATNKPSGGFKYIGPVKE